MTADFEAIRSEAEAIVARYERTQAAMLPVLHLVQAKLGCVTPEAEAWVAELLGVAPAHVHEVVTFYTLFHRQPIGRYHVQVCTNMSCWLNGSEQCLTQLSRRLGIQPGQTTADGRFTLSTVECLCACEQAPMLQLNDAYVGPVTAELIDRLVVHPDQVEASSLPFRGAPGLVEPVVSKRFNLKDSQLIETYVRDDGYQMARKAVTEMTPEQVINEVVKSNLRGLGGAGFPTGKKWGFIPRPATAANGSTPRQSGASAEGGVAGRGIIPKDAAKPTFLVVNADEGEPGTIKDRYLLERDPHRLIEGMIIAAYATGAKKAYIYIRGEYVEPARIFQQAVEEASTYGFLGKKIFNSEVDLEIVIHRGAGAYICGEETALLESLEGKKGFPRLKPPFPAISGLFGCPTVINNVETLSMVPTILQKGGEWFAKLGYGKSGGTRLFSVSGHVNRPGLYEASHGVTLRELIFDYAGGIPNGRQLKAVIPGGISAKLLRADEIDVRMDFDSLLAAGTMAGSAGVMVMDETTCMVKALFYASKFFAHESCGQCSPCREGTGWVHRIIERIAEGGGRPGDLDNLLQIASNMEGRTICVFADAAAWPVQSYVTKFKDEFKFHVREHHCNLSAPPEPAIA